MMSTHPAVSDFAATADRLRTGILSPMEVSARIINADSRAMPEIRDDSVDLAVTSPPYWHLKDYEAKGQIGYGQTLHEYLRDLYRVWEVCYQKIRPGGRLCVNVGDQFARAVVYGRYKVIPLHAEIIAQSERLGFDFLGSIIWQKRTTMNTTGGATIMGSFPHPPNGIVEIDYEYILIFKKPGKSKVVHPNTKEESRISKEQWKEWFTGHWGFGGARQVNHEATFPDELPSRLIRMFSFVGDTVLDPFLGSGTTAKVAIGHGRNVVGYELNQDFIDLIRKNLGVGAGTPRLFPDQIHFEKRDEQIDLAEVDYVPSIQDAKPILDPKKLKTSGDQLYKVIRFVDNRWLELDTGLRVELLGIDVSRAADARSYLEEYVVGKRVILEIDRASDGKEDCVRAYVHLKNRIFINAYMIKAGLADASQYEHRLRSKFRRLQKERDRNGQGVGA